MNSIVQISGLALLSCLVTYVSCCGEITSQGCPDGWVTSDDVDGCYWVSDRRLDWSLALRTCSKKNGLLLTIMSERENHFVMELLKSSGVDEIWTSLIYEGAPRNDWLWMDAPVYYQNWGETDPEPPRKGWWRGLLTTDNGGQWRYDQHMQVRDCIYEMPKGAAGACDDGWSTSDAVAHCYKVSQCGGGGLYAVILNQETDQFLINLLTQSGLSRARIGLSRTNGPWSWPLISAEYQPCEGRRGRVSDIGTVVVRNGNGRWSSAPAWSPNNPNGFRFVCQSAEPKESSTRPSQNYI